MSRKVSRMIGGPEDGLTALQFRFVNSYVQHRNATRAAREAGCKANTDLQMSTRGYDMLRNERVALAIKEKFAEMSRRLDITAERVLEEYARIAFGDPRMVMSWDPYTGIQLIPSSELTNDAAAMIAEVSETFIRRVDGNGEDDDREVMKLTVKFHSKTQALKDLATHLGLFKDGGPQVNVNIFVASARERVEGRLDGLAARIGAQGLLPEPK